MSDLNSLVDMLKISDIDSNSTSNVQKVDELKDISFEITSSDTCANVTPFDIGLFSKELYNKSSEKNKIYRIMSNSITSYDLASNCIREVVFRLKNTPVESFADKWLPIMMRSVLGNAIHEFIQNNSSQFTEKEVSIKVPSLRFSGRIDCLIGSSILVEIKSCTYSDYMKIINSRQPRLSDFYQAVCYKYFLENYLHEIKNSDVQIRTVRPALDKYYIKQIQFIYVAHDVTASDVESLDEILQRIKELKKLLNSRSNSFFFISSLVIDATEDVVLPYVNYIKDKLTRINYYLDNDIIPTKDDPYIDTSKCYFCLYSKLCSGRNLKL